MSRWRPKELDAELEKELDRERQEMQQALDETLEATIRKAWRPNAMAWIAAVGGSFLLNLLLLVLVAGG